MLEKVCDQLIDYYSRPDTQKKVQVMILDPIVFYIGRKLWPMFAGLMVSFIVLVAMLAYIVYVATRLGSQVKTV
jgi:hypothetical protein